MTTNENTDELATFLLSGEPESLAPPECPTEAAKLAGRLLVPTLSSVACARRLHRRKLDVAELERLLTGLVEQIGVYLNLSEVEHSILTQTTLPKTDATLAIIRRGRSVFDQVIIRRRTRTLLAILDGNLRTVREGAHVLKELCGERDVAAPILGSIYLNAAYYIDGLATSALQELGI